MRRRVALGHTGRQEPDRHDQRREGPVAARSAALADRRELGRREGDWKLLFNVNDTTKGPGTVIPGAFLVNLRDDPSEKRNVAAVHPEIVARLKRLRAEWEAGLK